jgi:diaminohydroxyphosphoribosylaminopyrimidine deaminase/5-amino-6-(5-phosphoribosylamino)uracil reductase
MWRCLQLAKLGMSYTAPNPLVGCVIVYQDRIIGEGYHKKYGEAHAEVNAIASIATQDLQYLPEATLYVNLEPCAHYGKTPPCTQLIIKNKIKRVVIGIQDKFSLVNGEGIKQLQNAGIATTLNILPLECYNLNRSFFRVIEKNRPYIILKWAKDSNGNIARQDKLPHWITQPISKRLTHKLRSSCQAILVGTNTIIYDNPKLDNRYFFGTSPIKIILDRHQRIDFDYNVFKGGNVIYFTSKDRLTPPNVEVIITEDFSLKNILSILFKKNIKSILVEGGKTLLDEFIQEQLWDEVWQYTGANNIDKGIQAPILNTKASHSFFINTDKIEVFLNP